MYERVVGWCAEVEQWEEGDEVETPGGKGGEGEGEEQGGRAWKEATWQGWER